MKVVVTLLTKSQDPPSNFDPQSSKPKLEPPEAFNKKDGALGREGGMRGMASIQMGGSENKGYRILGSL